MSLTADIYDAFAPLVTAFANSKSPALEVGYPGNHFDPPDSGEWIEIIANWNGSENYGLPDAGPTHLTGFFRLIVGARPSPNAMMTAQKLAEELVAEFAKGTTFGGALVYQAPSIGGPIQEDARLEIPVTVRWRAVR